MNPDPFPISVGYSIHSDLSASFALDAPRARDVRLAADFTNWEAGALPMERHAGGLWTVRTPPLAEGAHFYQYIVDGAWTLDPAHPMMEDNGQGGANSAMGVGGRDLGGPDALRVLSLNLHCHQEPDALLKLEQIAFAAWAMDVHALLLQEVGAHLSDPALPNAGDFLAKALSRPGETWRHEWMEAHVGFDVFREGVSILSRGPLENVERVELSGGPLRRVALTAETRLQGAPLRLGTVHTTWPNGGEPEVSALLKALGQEPPHGATLVAGDLNAGPNSRQVKLMGGARFHIVEPLAADAGGTFGFPARDRIDYQFLRLHEKRGLLREPWTLRMFNANVDANVYMPRVSDHVGLLGVYDFGEK